VCMWGGSRGFARQGWMYAVEEGVEEIFFLGPVRGGVGLRFRSSSSFSGNV